MIDFLPHVNLGKAFNLIVFLVLLLAFYRVVRGSNPLEFWHFISTHDANGTVYGDLDKLGQVIGLLFSTWVICFVAYSGHLTEWPGVVLFAAWLVYASGMGAFAKWARGFITSRYGNQPREPAKP